MPQDLARQFGALWESGDSPPDLFAFLEQHNGSDSADKLAILLQDQQHRWKTEEEKALSWLNLLFGVSAYI